jgi:5,6-dimethylbenzimidazole synthase
VRRLLHMPADAKPVAILCVGHVERFYDEPMLQAQGWAKRVPQVLCVEENRWPAAIQFK